ncbi:MAG: TlpA disulfide reductase family protein [Chitinophagaceae bacterium]
MKIICHLVLLLFCYTAINAQSPSASITCRYKGVNAGTINVLLPVNNNIFWGSEKDYPVSKEGSCTIPLSKTQTGYVIIRAFNNTVVLFVQPGDKLIADIDSAKKDAVKITGNNAEGQNLLNDGTTMPASYYSLVSKYSRDSTVALIATHAQQDKEKRLSAFVPLLQQNKINKAFFGFVKLTLDYAYAAAEGEALATKFYPTTLQPTHPSYKAVFPEDYAKAWDQLYQKYPVNNPELPRIPSFDIFSERYLNAYFWYKQVQRGDSIKVKDENDAVRMRMRWVDAAFPANLKEYVKASILYNIYLQQEFESVLPEVFKEYQQQYPKSPYTPSLVSMNDKVIAYHKAANGGFAGDEQVIEDYGNINSFAGLTEKFKGKMFYIDMWATWCGPCKAEFEFKDALHDYLKQKNIPMLYISMDVDKKDEQWKAMIKYYGLSGYHVRTSDALRKDLMNIFWDGKGYSIPRYVLVNAKGEIVVKNAKRPSDEQALYNQIESHIQ